LISHAYVVCFAAKVKICLVKYSGIFLLLFQVDFEFQNEKSYVLRNVQKQIKNA